MRTLLLATALGATEAYAGGIDQSGQPITLIFEDGDYAEIGLGYAMPSIEGVDPAGNRSGNVYNDVTDFGAGLKKQITQDWSAALIIDEPYGVIVNYDLDYPDVAFPFAGTHAQPDSLGVTGLLRYRIDERFSIHGGLRAERFGGEATLAGSGFGPLSGYEWTGDADWGLGYVVGGAYENPAIALRVALTYGSEIGHDLDAEENFFGPTTTEVTMPQSVNLDFQTGIAEKTLLYGLVRWVNWAGWKVQPAGLFAATGMPLVQFDSDSYTYRIGIGRQLTPTLAAALEAAHETPKDKTMTPLDPYDGYTGVGIGARYSLPSGLRISGGVAVNFLGDADVATRIASARFEDNRAVVARIRIGWAF